MQFNLSNAMAGFDLAETAELDCGEFDIVIRQAAAHNQAFKAAVSKKALSVKKKSLAIKENTVTGNEEADVELFAESVIVSWGTRPLRQDPTEEHPEGQPVPFNQEVLKALFMDTGAPGRVLFTKIMTAAMSDDTFVVRDEDIKNS